MQPGVNGRELLHISDEIVDVADKQMPLLLIMAGIMLSTLHQSSLGTLFLIVDKLDPLWYTPILPVLFLGSAVMVAPAMVIFESIMTSRILKRNCEMELLVPLGRAMPYLIGLYLLIRLADMIGRGAVLQTMMLSFESGWWWLEIGLLITALAHYSTPEVASQRRGLLFASVLTVLAVIVHRTGVAMIGINVPEYATYVPAWPEVMITVGIISIGLLGFRVAITVLPVYSETAPVKWPQHVGHPHAGGSRLATNDPCAESNP